MTRQSSNQMRPSDWIQGLLNPIAYPHPVNSVQLIETHISWLLLTGELAYKIKKPVSLGFVDFSTLERRRFFCEEELRLNRRLAPQLYLRAAKVTGVPSQPKLDGEGQIIDHAVCMRQFDNSRLLSRLAEEGALNADHIDQLADLVARFHTEIDAAAPDSSHASTDLIIASAMQNFDQISEYPDSGQQHIVEQAERWTVSCWESHGDTFRMRSDAGMIRECHGDMHLGNMFADEDDRVVVFDGIEFNESLRWIDLISEVAFTMMDLDDRGLSEFGYRFLNRWLETTGDYDGIRVLRFYLLYRAMVRAKVALIRAHQPAVESAESERLSDEYLGYLRLTERYTTKQTPVLVITCGPSGSGKTFGTQSVMESFEMIRVRSDVERKRIAGLAASDCSRSAPGTGLYAEHISKSVYKRLLETAEQILTAGFSVIVDATFLRAQDRHDFEALAKRLELPFVIMKFTAPASVLKERVRRRLEKSRDASEATEDIVDMQLRSHEPLSDQELQYVIDARSPDLTDQILQRMVRQG